jgi:hypothetical protein
MRTDNLPLSERRQPHRPQLIGNALEQCLSSKGYGCLRLVTREGDDASQQGMRCEYFCLPSPLCSLPLYLSYMVEASREGLQEPCRFRVVAGFGPRF